MRAVIDTNVVISGMLWSGRPRTLLQAIESGHGEIFTTEALVDELRDVLHRPKFTKYLQRLQKSPEDLVTMYLGYAKIVEPTTVPKNAIRDVKDVKVLEAALGGEVDCIVSGDDDLLSLKTYSGIDILSPLAFLSQIEPDDVT